MDTKLFEALLMELLQLPQQHRTAEKIMANLMLAASAAGVSLTQAAPLQIEHLQLSAALDLLAQHLGPEYRGRAMLRLGGGLEGVELGGALEPRDPAPNQQRFIAFGATARGVLAGLNRDIRERDNKPAPKKKRLAGSLSLKTLASQLDSAA